jgi:hypothetical protein
MQATKITLEKNGKTLTVTVKDGGEVEIEANGFTGTSCLEATRNLEVSLGKVATRKAKAEQYDKEQTCKVTQYVC